MASIKFLWDKQLPIPDSYRQHSYSDTMEYLLPFEVEGGNKYSVSEADLKKAFWEDQNTKGSSSYGALRWKGQSEFLKAFPGYGLIKYADVTHLCD